MPAELVPGLHREAGIQRWGFGITGKSFVEISAVHPELVEGWSRFLFLLPAPSLPLTPHSLLLAHSSLLALCFPRPSHYCRHPTINIHRCAGNKTRLFRGQKGY